MAKTLTEQFKKILKDYDSEMDMSPVDALIKAVLKRDEYVIGEDEKDAAVYENYTANSEHFRNELKSEQRERADETI